MVRQVSKGPGTRSRTSSNGRSNSDPGADRSAAPVDTRQRILDAARAAFAERGYVDTPIDDIITRCGVSRGTFYYYFKNKADIFEQLAWMVNKELVEHSRNQLSGGDAFEKIEAANRGFLESFEKYRDVVRNEWQIATIEPRFAKLLHDLRMQFISRIQRNLERSVVSGEIRKLDARIAAFALGGMLDWFAYNWLSMGMVDGDNFTIEHVARELSDLWYHALYGRTDRELASD
jgi:AcrR family transcriptional regulator